MMLITKIERHIFIDKEEDIDPRYKHKDVTFNEGKVYACGLGIFTSDFDYVRIQNTRSKLDKKLEQTVVRELINSNVMDERSIK